MLLYVLLIDQTKMSELKCIKLFDINRYGHDDCGYHNLMESADKRDWKAKSIGRRDEEIRHMDYKRDEGAVQYRRDMVRRDRSFTNNPRVHNITKIECELPYQTSLSCPEKFYCNRLY